MNAETEKAVAWGEAKYTLLFPVPLENAELIAKHGANLTDLSFREPDGEVLEALDEIGLEEGKQPKVKQVNQMIAIMSGVPVEVVRKFNQRDIEGASMAFAPLLAAASVG